MFKWFWTIFSLVAPVYYWTHGRNIYMWHWDCVSDTVVYAKAQDSMKKLSLMSRHILNKMKTFQYTHFTSCRPQNFNGFALQTPLKQLLRQLLRKSFQFQKLLMDRGYPYNLKEKVLSEINSKKVCVPETKLNSKEEKDLPFSGNTNPKSLLI